MMVYLHCGTCLGPNSLIDNIVVFTYFANSSPLVTQCFPSSVAFLDENYTEAFFQILSACISSLHIDFGNMIT